MRAESRSPWRPPSHWLREVVVVSPRNASETTLYWRPGQLNLLVAARERGSLRSAGQAAPSGSVGPASPASVEQVLERRIETDFQSTATPRLPLAVIGQLGRELLGQVNGLLANLGVLDRDPGTTRPPSRGRRGRAARRVPRQTGDPVRCGGGRRRASTQGRIQRLIRSSEADGNLGQVARLDRLLERPRHADRGTRCDRGLEFTNVSAQTISCDSGNKGRRSSSKSESRAIGELGLATPWRGSRGPPLFSS